MAYATGVSTDRAATWAKRFADVCAGYEAEGPDSTVPGASRQPERYAVVTESLRGHGYSVNYAASLERVERVAAANIHEGWQPVCYYDLDELAGEEPPIGEGDRVMHDGDRNWYVVGTESEFSNGEIIDIFFLSHEADSAEWEIQVPDYHVSIVERSEPDDRIAKRYLVAGIRTLVVFNTKSEES